MTGNGCAIITGASRGIGAAAAREIAKPGYNVIINYRSCKEKAQEVLDEIRLGGGDGMIFKADVSNRNEVDSMVSAAAERFGKIEILVNNAGIAQQKLFTDITINDWSRMIDVNLGGVFNCCQSVLPYMIHEKKGKIINVSSIWGVQGASCEVHYSAAKAGIIGL